MCAGIISRYLYMHATYNVYGASAMSAQSEASHSIYLVKCGILNILVAARNMRVSDDSKSIYLDVLCVFVLLYCLVSPTMESI